MRLVVLTVAGLLVVGCAPPQDRAMPSNEDLTVIEDLATSLEVGIASGEVRFTFHMTNTAAAPLELTFPTSQRYDFVVEDAEGQPVWRWSDDRSFLQAITHATLEPGETWTMESTWEPGDATGELVATGRLTATERRIERRASFELP